MKLFLFRHTLISIYFIVFLGLLYGVYLNSGFNYFFELLTYFGSLLFFYFLFTLKPINKFISNRLDFFESKKISLNIYYLLVPCCLFVIFHLIYLGGSPAIAAANLNYIEDVAILRHDLTENVPTFIAYGSAISLKSVLPFLLLYLLYTKRQVLYWIVLIIGCFYAFSLIQKSFIVGLLLPSLIFSLAERKFLYSFKYVGLMVLVVLGLTYISNPSGGWSKEAPNRLQPPVEEEAAVIVDPATSDVEPFKLLANIVQEIIVRDELPFEISSSTKLTGSVSESPANINEVVPVVKTAEQRKSDSLDIVNQAQKSKLELILTGLMDRLFVVPGRVVSDWFETIPAKKPFLYGDGYRVLAKIRGREYHNYAKELYAIIQPEFASQGLAGSVNVASFMYEYSNFGTAGMVLSGFMLALLFILVETFFADNFKIKLSLNLFPVLLLSSGAITTLMFSGGWGFSILFYFLFLKNKSE